MSAADVTAPDIATEPPAGAWMILLVLSLAYFLTQLDVAVLAVAVPSMMSSLHAATDQIVWALSAYILVFAVALITAGRLGDLYGRRRVFLAGVALFTIGSLAAAATTTAGQLIAARAIQGLGAALIAPQTLALIVDTYPPGRRGTALGIRGAVGGTAAIGGPVVGGLLVNELSWRWVFLINVPLGVGMFVLAAIILPAATTHRRHRLDLLGVGLISAALLCLAFPLTQGARYGWNAAIIGLFIVSAVLLAAFIAQQRRQQNSEPLVPFTLFRNRNYSLMTVYSLTTSGTVIGLILVLSLYFQNVLALTALGAGLLIAPASLMSTVFDPLAGKLSDRVQGRYLLFAGAVLTVGGMLWTAAYMHAGASGWTPFIGPMCVIGIGNAFLFTPLAVVALGSVASEESGAASGVLVTVLQIGSMLGAVGVGALLHDQTRVTLTAAEARTAMEFLAVVAAVGAIASLATGNTLAPPADRSQEA